MFSRILLPVDGSELSAKAIRQAVEFAREAGASLVAFHAAPVHHPMVYEGFVPPDYMAPARVKEATERHARRVLAPAEKACEKAGVPCEARFVVHDSPYEAIIAAAKKHRCDLIVMASHGRRGLSGLLLGSETMKVLTHGRTPVLVLR
ncbi:MAG: universal stress protein [bacterium]|jgi:nucleotide-binding universal stress UspA family protein|nr:universal stress protein [Betaproteobacteria bacterium]